MSYAKFQMAMVAVLFMSIGVGTDGFVTGATGAEGDGAAPKTDPVVVRPPSGDADLASRVKENGEALLKAGDPDRGPTFPLVRCSREAKLHDGKKVAIIGLFQTVKTKLGNLEHRISTAGETLPQTGSNYTVDELLFDLSCDQKRFRNLEKMDGKRVLVMGCIRYVPQEETVSEPQHSELSLEDIRVRELSQDE